MKWLIKSFKTRKPSNPYLVNFLCLSFITMVYEVNYSYIYQLFNSQPRVMNFWVLFLRGFLPSDVLGRIDLLILTTQVLAIATVQFYLKLLTQIFMILVFLYPQSHFIIDLQKFLNYLVLMGDLDHLISSCQITMEVIVGYFKDNQTQNLERLPILGLNYDHYPYVRIQYPWNLLILVYDSFYLFYASFAFYPFFPFYPF